MSLGTEKANQRDSEEPRTPSHEDGVSHYWIVPRRHTGSLTMEPTPVLSVIAASSRP